MNDTDTIDLLRAGLAGHHHTRPLEDVLARGSAIRSRRRRPALVAAAAVLAAAGVTTVVTFSSPSPAYADWSATPETTPTNVATAIDASCRTAIGDPTARLAVLDRRGSNAVVVYTSTAGDYQCSRFLGSDDVGSAGWWTQGAWGGPTAPTGSTDPLEVTNISAGVNVHEGAMTALSGRVGPDVSRVTASVGGRVIEGAIGSGAFDVWWPAVGAEEDTITITTYGSDTAASFTKTLVVPGFSVE